MRSTVFMLAFALVLTSAGALGQDTAKAPAIAPAPGEVQLKTRGGGTYIGTVTNGVPDGKGFFQDADGTMYEGEVRMGERTGVAEGVYPHRDIYQGEWKNGHPDGRGKMTYMLGGSYDGEWKNGKRDGRGTMVFVGSGRRAAVRFVDDIRVDPTTGEPLAPRIPGKTASGAVPADRGFAELTPEQRQLVRNEYPTLEEGDDPPYPITGGKELYSALKANIGRLGVEGTVWVYVTVDAQGKAVSVTTAGVVAPDIRRAIGTAAGLLAYTPARCSGQPCPGIWGIGLHLVLE